MRKRSTYRARPKSAPMLINRGLAECDIETRERMIVEAFAGGWANTDHFDALADMRAVLVLAAAAKQDHSTLAICDAMKIPMANLRERYARLKRFGLSGDELQLLRVFIDQYRDFWMRQPVTLYVDACDGLNRAYEMGIVKEQA